MRVAAISGGGGSGSGAHCRQAGAMAEAVAEAVTLSGTIIWCRGSFGGFCAAAIADTALDWLVRARVREHPNAGYRLMRAYLCTQGVRVQECRVRSSLRRVDPSGVGRRWSRHRCIHHRRYSVPHPNAVWHIDGNMSLIRWELTVNSGIDGYSRLVTYL